MTALDLERLSPLRRRSTWAAGLLVLVAGCTGDDGDDGAPGPGGPPGPGSSETSRELDKGEAEPGVVVEILDVSGATGPGGTFAVGDRLSFTYSLEQDDGRDWRLDEMDFGRALVSGPTFNYQRVLAEVTDLSAASVDNGDGTYTYTFASAIPATYLAPLNDTPSFDADDGELTGQALLDGTYTLGVYFGWNYTVVGESGRDSGDDTFDFAFGPTGTVDSRAVVSTDNCNRCHAELQFHGGLRRSSTLCLLCHTAGAEDRNTPGVAGGTPGVTIDFQVMIHKIHNAAHLPSVLGVTTDMTGARDYTATPQPYQMIGFGNNVTDFSDIHFPAWPNFVAPMPRDAGYSTLGGAEQDLEDEMRSGTTSCYLCHGDADGAGPLAAPAQGDLAYSQPSRRACTSCHEDWIPELPYAANTQVMPPQFSDGGCTVCHAASGTGLAVRDAHLHPLRDPSFAGGFVLDVTDVAEAGTNDGDGTLDPGEGVNFTFTIRDDMGLDLDPATLVSLDAALTGPADNPQLVGIAGIPLDAVTGGQPYTLSFPERVYYEYVGDDAPGIQMYTTARAPHWNLAGVETEVWARTGLGAGSTTLAAAVTAPVNFVDVVDSTGFARDDFVVIDDGGAREYLQIQLVDGNRLWFSSPQTTDYAPGPTVDHAMGVTVDEVLLTQATEGAAYSIDEATGTITELVDFGTTQAVVVSYTTDFVVPAEYPLTLNAGPELGEVQGGWTGKSLVDGTYSLTLWGRRDLTLNLWGETNAYRDPAPGVKRDFLVGDATVVEPYDAIASVDGCNRCHVDLAFHGSNRRGVTACLACHALAATGDRPRYVAANAPPTDDTSIDFAQMLHAIHMGAELDAPTDYVVVGFGTGYPNNFSEHTYEEVHFPAFPSGVKDCAVCHGNDAWTEPPDLSHPTEQGTPARGWRLVCGACHDSDAAGAHMDTQTSPTAGEACATCHGPGKVNAVEAMHVVR